METIRCLRAKERVTPEAAAENFDGQVCPDCSFHDTCRIIAEQRADEYKEWGKENDTDRR